jgi:hypothetical protein
VKESKSMTDGQSIGEAKAAIRYGTESEAIATRIFLRPIASPLSLGFLALGGATLVLSGSQLGWFAPQETSYVALALITFGAPLQLLASIFGFLARDPAAATGMGVLAASWFTTGLVKLNSAAAATSTVLGVFLVFASAALFVPAIGAAFGKLVPAIVLLTAAALLPHRPLPAEREPEPAVRGRDRWTRLARGRVLRGPGADDRRRATQDRAAGATRGRRQDGDEGQRRRPERKDRERSRSARAALRLGAEMSCGTTDLAR